MLFIGFSLTACQKTDNTQYLPAVNAERLSYLEQWSGVYEGTSHHAYSHPSCPGYTCYVTDYYYKSVVVTVELSTLDSCVNLTVVYDTTTTEIHLKTLAQNRIHWFLNHELLNLKQNSAFTGFCLWRLQKKSNRLILLSLVNNIIYDFNNS